jgi:hypothetical protein
MEEQLRVVVAHLRSIADDAPPAWECSDERIHLLEELTGLRWRLFGSSAVRFVSPLTLSPPSFYPHPASCVCSLAHIVQCSGLSKF